MIPGLHRSLVQARATPAVFERGEAYCRTGAVRALRYTDTALHATVKGTQSYDVTVSFDAGGVRGTRCTCPYEYGGWCKHIVAVLLAALDQDVPAFEIVSLDDVPSLSFEEEALEEALANASPATLLEAVRRLVGGGLLSGSDVREALAQAAPSLDAGYVKATLRDAVQALGRMPDSEAYWHVSGVADLAETLRQRLLAAWYRGDGSALDGLGALTQELLRALHRLDDSDGALGVAADELAYTWGACMLAPHLSPKQRGAWHKKLGVWHAKYDEMGLSTFAVAVQAARDGWDAPALRRLLDGGEVDDDALGAALGFAAPAEADDARTPPDDAPLRVVAFSGASARTFQMARTPEQYARLHAERMLALRLDALEAGGHHGLAERLARLGPDRARHVALLFGLDRPDDARAEARRYHGEASQHLALADTLRTHGHLYDALAVARAGLDRTGRFDAALAEWTADLADALGDRDAAVEAGATLFRLRPTVHTLERLRALSGEAGGPHETAVLDGLRATPRPDTFEDNAVAALWLYLDEPDEAIACVGASYWDPSALALKVAEAVWPARPVWALDQATHHAEAIAERGTSGKYDVAVRWLAVAARAHEQHGTWDDWQAYFDAYRETHRRKHALMKRLGERFAPDASLHPARRPRA